MFKDRDLEKCSDFLGMDNVAYLEQMEIIARNGNANADSSRAKVPSSEFTQPEAFCNAKNQSYSLDLANKILKEVYRKYGHYSSKINPLSKNYSECAGFLPKIDEILKKELNKHGILEFDLNLKEQLDLSYCGSIGYEIEHIRNQAEIEWLYAKIENNQCSIDDNHRLEIFRTLNNVETLEKYLNSKYVGQTRFSIEGVDALIPLLLELLAYSRANGSKEIAIGMSHRGRLNVLVNVLGQEIAELMRMFEAKIYTPELFDDVKYHLGRSAVLSTASGDILATLLSNPSHLELVDPVVLGYVKSKQILINANDNFATSHGHSHEDFAPETDCYTLVVPVLIHGDAALTGQGIVMETLNFSAVDGFKVGGTIHIITNNQIGFTTECRNSRSGVYCTDIAKFIDAPVIHVNADDIEAVIKAIRLACEYRHEFFKDVFIDLIGYRRYGHNEGDDPSATQPLMYAEIKNHPCVRDIYRDFLINKKLLTQLEADKWTDEYIARLDQGKVVIDNFVQEKQLNCIKKADFPIEYSQYLNSIETTVTLKNLQSLSDLITSIPENFTLHPQVARIFSDRKKMTNGEIKIDWGYAENMAYASLLSEKFHIRMSGQDCKRGTFFHRHAHVFDYKTGEEYSPLVNLTKHSGEDSTFFTETTNQDHVAGQDAILQTISSFCAYNSPLSEAGVLGFEHGYAIGCSVPKIVIWEAQYGDFSNGAQSVIDQFIACSEAKWGEVSNLILLLPHAYEGAGPEHSSGRLERYIQLSAGLNIRICMPSNASQIFHLIRNQAKSIHPRPLIIMTPKSLLRNELAKSNLEDLVKGKFSTVIADKNVVNNEKVERIVVCSGKIYCDLMDAYKNIDTSIKTRIAIIRLEQFVPFPEYELTQEFLKYENVKDFIWCQEETQNAGAWSHILMASTVFYNKIKNFNGFRYVGRNPSSSSATGLKYVHLTEQKSIIDDIFGF